MWGLSPDRGVCRNAGSAIKILIALVFCTGAIHAQNCAPTPPDLVGWWKGDGNATDAVGNNNGTLIGNAGFSSGIVGQAFSFDGIDDYLSIPSSASLNVGPGNGLTIEGWIKPADLSTSRPLFEWDSNSGQSFGAHFWSSANRVSSVLPGALFA